MDTPTVLGGWPCIVFCYSNFCCFYSVVALLQRNWDLVAKIAGVPSIAETMQEETHGIDVALAGESSAEAKE